MRIGVLLVWLLLLVGCEVKDEAHRRAATITEGMTEQQALAIAVTPSRIYTTDSFLFCQKPGYVRILVYDATTEYFRGWKKTTDGSVILCLNAGGIVIEQSLIDY